MRAKGKKKKNGIQRKRGGDGFREVEERGYWGGQDIILITLDRHECFSVFHHLQKDKQRKQRHSLKLGKKRRESSKRNYYIISPRVIIKAIIIISKNPFKKALLERFYSWAATIYFHLNVWSGHVISGLCVWSGLLGDRAFESLWMICCAGVSECVPSALNPVPRWYSLGGAGGIC